MPVLEEGLAYSCCSLVSRLSLLVEQLADSLPISLSFCTSSSLCRPCTSLHAGLLEEKCSGYDQELAEVKATIKLLESNMTNKYIEKIHWLLSSSYFLC